MPRHYRIGPVAVTLCSDVPGVADDYHGLYRTCETPEPAPGAFRIDVVTRRSPRSGRRHFHILAQGQEEYTVRKERQILSHVEGAVNLCIARHLPTYLQIHASAVAHQGRAVILAAPPGSGKTTLAAALLARGWSYYSDEFALIDPQTRRLEPYPKALSIKSGSFRVLAQFGLPIEGGPLHERGAKGWLRCLNPLDIRPDAVARPLPVGTIILPAYGNGEPPLLEPISRARAVFELSQLVFNFMKFRAGTIELLADVARGAHCYRLRSGELNATCELVESCLARAGRKRRSA